MNSPRDNPFDLSDQVYLTPYGGATTDWKRSSFSPCGYDTIYAESQGGGAYYAGFKHLYGTELCDLNLVIDVQDPEGDFVGVYGFVAVTGYNTVGNVASFLQGTTFASRSENKKSQQESTRPIEKIPSSGEKKQQAPVQELPKLTQQLEDKDPQTHQPEDKMSEGNETVVEVDTTRQTKIAVAPEALNENQTENKKGE
ncbi:unnamed protein product [Cyprideis torosa]|uniref:Uncharacterized protein n=1 Tax=Cyprideis torosa TaxID=163714 RepID=A0A7R8WGI8_9CRUS|nr:unnamed protein product [Cyprideis torosa]CAG0893055.1 unnamed protein product [Cyprideis torosa]